MLMMMILPLITYQTQRLSETPQYTSLEIGVVLIHRKVAGHRHERERLSGFDEKSLRGLTYLTTFCFSLPKFYIEMVLLPHTNNRTKGDPLSFGTFLWFIGLCILITYNPGYIRRFFRKFN